MTSLQNSISDSKNSEAQNNIHIKLSYNSKDFQFKKFLRGRLIKLINDSIILEEPPTQSPPQNELHKKNHDNQEKSPKNKGSKFIVKKFPNLIGRENYIVGKSNDSYVTAAELIYKNFTESEIDLIHSEPFYFKLNLLDRSNKMNYLKKQTLVQKINDEEKRKKFSDHQINARNVKFKNSINIISNNYKQYNSLPMITLPTNQKTKVNNRGREKNNIHSKIANLIKVSHSTGTLKIKNDPIIKFKAQIERKNIAQSMISKILGERNERAFNINQKVNLERHNQNQEQNLIKNLKSQIKKHYLKIKD